MDTSTTTTLPAGSAGDGPGTVVVGTVVGAWMWTQRTPSARCRDSRSAAWGVGLASRASGAPALGRGLWLGLEPQRLLSRPGARAGGWCRW